MGDLIELKDEDGVPADCILVNTMNTKGEAFTSAKTLEGNLDLRKKQMPLFVKNNFPRIFCKNADYKLRLEMDFITKDYESFSGRVTVDYEGPELQKRKAFQYAMSIGFCLTAKEPEAIIEEKMKAIDTARSGNTVVSPTSKDP